jgi:hypothetical protein
MGREARCQGPAFHSHKGDNACRYILLPSVSSRFIHPLQYSVGWPRTDPTVQQKILYAGNGSKSIRLSVEGSLKKLRTNYIDLLYVHFYDYSTSIEELMQALHALVLRGQVLYLVSRPFFKFYNQK